MYHLIYTIPFNDVDGNAYTVQILEDGGSGSSVELTGGTPPFIVDINDEDFLYTPTRFSGATLKIVGSDYLQRLFSTQYQKFKVNLLKGSSVIWTGFITPEIYSQDYTNDLFELEIECISALSTLEYIDFTASGDTISLQEIINKCVTASKGDYNGIYIPKSYTSSLNAITVSISNFFDDEGKPMTLKECLEEVCKFLNWTVTEYNGNVYFIDVDYIIAGKTDYFKGSQSVKLNSNINLRDIPSKGNNNTLSILGGYNKAVVIASDYEVDPERIYPETDFVSLGIGAETDFTFKDTVHKRIIARSYNFDTITYDANFKPIDMGIQYDLAGCYASLQTSFPKDNLPNKLDFDNVFWMKQNYKNNAKMLYNATDSEMLTRPMIKLNKEAPQLLVTPDYTFAIDFKCAITIHQDGFLYDNPDDPKFETFTNESFYLLAKFKIGNYYYNGETNKWTTDSSNYMKILTTVNKDNWNKQWFECYNQNSFITGYDELNGYIVKVDRILIGKPELIIYGFKHPYFPINNPIYYKYNPTCFFLKDLTLKSQKKNLYNASKDKEDTKYENVVNSEFINQCEDIKFLITSKNDSNLSFSKAILNGNVLDKLSNSIYNTEEKPEELMIKRIVNQYDKPRIKLYQEIRPDILPYSVISDNGKKYIFTGGTINYEDNKIEANLIELWK